ncbi:hypothetical protein [Limnobacter sp.]|uniref:hypothetical protein n=1 Tax=Limnobacter sp. TaxID=2003368 RepID=UPI002FE038B4
MNSSKGKLILLELNEINFDVVNKYLDLHANRFPALKSILAGPWIRTTSENKYEELEPWIQWPSVHTTKTYAEHGVFRLGDIVYSDTPQIFEKLEDAGFKVGVVSAMNAANRLKNPAYFIPDPWTQTPPDSSWWSRSLSEAISQAVNDNAQATISLKSKFRLALGLLRFARISHYSKYLSLIIKSRKKPWLKALVLDLFLHDFHWSIFKSKNPNFSTLFLNAGAHIQHHYFFNSIPLRKDLTERNPEWYAKSNNDPLADALDLYDLIIGEYFSRSDIDIVLATGLAQKPYNQVKFYYRLQSHSDFLKDLGINFSRVFPRMTRDFLVEFDNENQAIEAKRILSSVVVQNEGLQLFGEIDYRGTSLFVTLTYPNEINSNTLYTRGNRTEHLLPRVTFVAIKNGTHQAEGFAFFTPGILSHAPSNLSHVACLGMTIMKYFGLNASERPPH